MDLSLRVFRSRFRAPACRAPGLVALLAAAALAAGAGSPAGAQTCATLPGGATLCGALDTTVVGGDTVHPAAYRGIPYAKAPVGPLRWRPPQDTALAGTLQATSFGDTCPKSLAHDTLPDGKVVTTLGPGQSESCLFLNVWTPPGATAASRLPVMVFIHGGAFVIGAGSLPTYNGAYLAAADTVVLVTLNYRLGALGFLYHQAAGAGSAGDVGGNLGLLDQQKAMQWVRRNVGAFGGDSARVTIFGESAGAMSVGFHLFAMPSSDSLFRAAIMESNPIGITYRDTAQASADGAAFAGVLCRTATGDVVCLEPGRWFAQHFQSVPVDSVVLAQGRYELSLGAIKRLVTGGLPEGLPWTPVIDGSVTVGQPLNGWAPAMPRRKPYVFGMNRDEGVIFAGLAAAAAKAALDPATYEVVLAGAFGAGGAARITEYRAAGGESPYDPLAADTVAGMDRTASALANLVTDLIFDCGNLASADSASEATGDAGPPVFGYRFEQSPIPFLTYDTALTKVCTPETGMVCHADELPYVFNTLAAAMEMNGNTGTLGPSDAPLARRMAAAWGSFAKNPLAAPAGGWTPYNAAGGALYTWGGPGDGTMQTGLSTSASCTRLWSTLPPLKPGSTR